MDFSDLENIIEIEITSSSAEHEPAQATAGTPNSGNGSRLVIDECPRYALRPKRKRRGDFACYGSRRTLNPCGQDGHGGKNMRNQVSACIGPRNAIIEQPQTVVVTERPEGESDTQVKIHDETEVHAMPQFDMSVALITTVQHPQDEDTSQTVVTESYFFETVIVENIKTEPSVPETTVSVTSEELEETEPKQKAVSDKEGTSHIRQRVGAHDESLIQGSREPSTLSPPLRSDYQMTLDELRFLHYLVECQKLYSLPVGMIDLQNDTKEVISGKISGYLLSCIEYVTLFARSIAGFDAIIQDDQLLLLKRAAFEVLFIRAKGLYHTASDQFIFCQLYLQREFFLDWVFCGSKNFSDGLFNFWRFCHLSVEKNPEFAALLSAWRIVRNLDGLKEPGKVKDLLTYVTSLIERYIGGMHENDQGRAREIIIDLEAMECVARECMQIIPSWL